jgi:hypothetical protein
MRVDRRFLAGSATKAQPKRTNLPSYTGTIEAEFKNLDDYNKFVNGTTFGINASWNGATIEGRTTMNLLSRFPLANSQGQPLLHPSMT